MAQKDKRKLMLAIKLNRLSNLFYFLSASLIILYALYFNMGNVFHTLKTSGMDR